MNLGEYLQKIRSDRGMTIREAAEKGGISGAEISRLENGKRLRPSPDVLKALAKAYESDYAALLRTAGYIEDVHEDETTYEKVYTNKETGEIVEVIRGAKQMMEEDERWANIAFRVSRNLSQEARQTIANLVEAYLENEWKKNNE